MLPLSAAKRLSDYGGNFVLSVLCQNPTCRHERAIPAAALARRAGRDAFVVDVVKRLRCSRCNRRRVDVLVAGIPR